MIFCSVPLQDTEADNLDNSIPQYQMTMEGDLPRFIVATPEYLRKMDNARKSRDKRASTVDSDLQQQLAGPRGGGLKRKKRKGKWA